MRLVQPSGADTVPIFDPLTVRVASIARRASVSRQVANVLVDLTFGPARRDDVLALAVCTASRVAEACR